MKTATKPNSGPLDPMEALRQLDEEHRKMRLEEEALAALAELRASLAFSAKQGAPFFCSLAYSTEHQVEWKVPTACTDGKSLRVNPEFFMGLTDGARMTVYHHELMHDALQHPAQFKALLDRAGMIFPDVPKRAMWALGQMALDCTVNGLLAQSGTQYEWPGDCVRPGEGKFKFLPAPTSKMLNTEQYLEEIVKWWRKQPKSPEDGDGDGDFPGGGIGDPNGDPGGTGAVDALLEDAQKEALEERLQRAVMVAREALKGDQPGWLTEIIGRITHKPLHYMRLVERHLEPIMFPDEASWRRPNRRYLPFKLIFPVLGEEKFPHVGIDLDVSGSIDSERIARFCEDIFAFIAGVPTIMVTILVHDVNVTSRHTWRPEDGAFRGVTIKGRGGTSHIPSLTEFGKMEDPPELVLCLTDLYTDFPDRPKFPVVWIVPPGLAENAKPWGETIPMHE